MSRCFPFPPPGYEEKLRPDDANLLTKEKSKEKKEKKEKDKEKKERKGKRHKEKSEETRREKKEKKRKDKKDKDKDEKKKRTSEEKVLETSEHQNGEKLSPIRIQGTDSEPQFLLELEKRFRHDDGARESKMFEKIVAADKGCDGLQGKFTESAFDVMSEAKEKRSVGLRGKFTESAFDVMSEAKEKVKDETEDQRMVNGQTHKVVARGLENGVVSCFMGEDWKQVEGGDFPLEKVNEKQKERKEKKKHRRSDGKREKHKDRDQRKQNKSKDKKGEKEKEKEERSREQTEQSNLDTIDIHGNGPSYLFKESNGGNGNLGKRKYPESDGVLHDDDSRPTKLSRPVSSSHQVMHNGSKCEPSQIVLQFASNAKVSLPQSLLGNGRKLDSGHIVHSISSEQKSTVKHHKVQNSILLTQPVRGTGRSLQSPEAATNLKILEPGVLSDHKVNYKVSTSPWVVENLGNIQTAVERQEPSCPPKVDNKRHMINGLRTQESKQIEEKIGIQKRSPDPDPVYTSKILIVDNKVSSSQPDIQTAVERQGALFPMKMDNMKHMVNGQIKTRESKKGKEKVETHKRSPHPDSKYLNQILTVPEVEWSDFDDQEWLFSSGDSKTKKPRTVSSHIEEAKQVWAEALRVESADVVLPYVIPY